MGAKTRRVAVQIKSDDPQLLLSRKERDQITDQLSGSLDVCWLPSIGKKSLQRVLHDHLTTELLVFLFGTGLFWFMKSFCTAFGKELGKQAGKGFLDTLRALKRLVARTWKTQSDKSYALSSTAYLFFEVGSDYVVVPLKLTRAGKGETTIRKSEAIVQRSLKSLANSWPKTRARIERARIGKDMEQPQLYLLRKTAKGAWTLHPVESNRFSVAFM